MNRIYLSGTDYAGTIHSTWQDQFTSFFKNRNVFFISPKFETRPTPLIVIDDKRNIDICNILVAYIATKTCGTSMEIIYAHQNNLNVYIIDPTNIVSEDPWIKYHSQHIFPTIDVCAYHILEQHIDEK